VRFQTYFDSLVLGIRQVSNYRAEMWLGLVTRLIGLVGLLVLWIIIFSENQSLNIKEIISYLLIANSVRDAIDALHLKLSKEFINEIKMGTISSHLLRPINTKLFFYFRFAGSRGIGLVFDFILLTIGIYLNPPKSALGVVLFVVSIVIASGLAYCFNVFVGTLSFWTTEASGLRNVANHFLKVFSGSMVPISYFPDLFKGIILLSPFPVLSYLPATFISGRDISIENIQSLIMSVIWLIGLIPAINYLWLKGIKDYDAVGI